MGSAVKSVGGFLQGNVLDPLRGKVNIPDQYKVSEAAYTNSPEQQAYQESLRQQSLGISKIPSQAQLQLKEATDRNLAQISGRAASQRGNQALGLREAMRAQAGAGQAAAAQAASLRGQEMQQAQGAYGEQLTRQQSSLQNREALKSGIAGATQQLQTGANLNKQQETSGLIKGAATAGLTQFGSDINIKKDIKKISPSDIEDFATKLSASKFKYKQPNGESYQNGTVTGIMAQDLEKSKIGKEMVVDSSEGKMVDMKRAIPATMAAVSEVMKRIKKLESKKSKKEEV